jgi:hypothetical protein
LYTLKNKSHFLLYFDDIKEILSINTKILYNMYCNSM